VNGQRIGYVRVSALDQNPDRQLEQIPVDRTFTDHASGKDVARPQLDALLRFAREGDTVVVHSMDRLARNLDDLRQIVRQLTGRGIRVELIKEGLAFTGEDAPMATLLLSVMRAFAEFERALVGERQREGIALARRRGVYRGERRHSPPTSGRNCANVSRRGRGRRRGRTGSAARPSTSTCARRSNSCRSFLDLCFVRDLVADSYAGGGRPSIDPEVFFRLQLMMFFEGIRSERKLLEQTGCNRAIRWYAGYNPDEPLPDHSSLSKIRTRLGLPAFRRFFDVIVEQCVAAGLVWGKELIFDATNLPKACPLVHAATNLVRHAKDLGAVAFIGMN